MHANRSAERDRSRPVRSLAAGLVTGVALLANGAALAEGWTSKTYVDETGWSAVIEYLDPHGRVARSETVGSFEKRADARRAAEKARRERVEAEARARRE